MLVQEATFYFQMFFVMIVVGSILYNNNTISLFLNAIDWQYKLCHFIDNVKRFCLNCFNSDHPKYVETPIQVLSYSSVNMLQSCILVMILWRIRSVPALFCQLDRLLLTVNVEINIFYKCIFFNQKYLYHFSVTKNMISKDDQ